MTDKPDPGDWTANARRRKTPPPEVWLEEPRTAPSMWEPGAPVHTFANNMVTGEVRVVDTVRARILDEAKALVSVERQDDYGSAKGNFNKIAALWREAFGWDVHPYHVPLAMDLVKTARLTSNPSHHDSWVDKAGYSALGAEIVQEDRA